MMGKKQSFTHPKRAGGGVSRRECFVILAPELSASRGRDGGAPLQARPLARGGLSAVRATGGGIRVVTRFHVPDFFGSQGLLFSNRKFRYKEKHHELRFCGH